MHPVLFFLKCSRALPRVISIRFIFWNNSHLIYGGFAPVDPQYTRAFSPRNRMKCSVSHVMHLYISVALSFHLLPGLSALCMKRIRKKHPPYPLQGAGVKPPRSTSA